MGTTSVDPRVAGAGAGQRIALSPADLAIVIVTHQSEGALGPMLECLGDALLPLVLVIDNGSSDGTVAIARGAGVRTLENRENVGYGAACNQGATAVDARVLCFLNPDCQPTADLFDQGHAAVRPAANTWAAPILVEPGGIDVPGRQPGYSQLKIAFDVLETNCGGPLWRWMTRLPHFHDRSWSWPHGACWFVDRQAYLDIGGMSPRFFLYMEDVDFGRRWSRAAGQAVQLDYRLPHRQGHSSHISRARRRALLNRARIDYAAAHHGRWLARLLQCATIPDRIVRRLFPQSS